MTIERKSFAVTLPSRGLLYNGNLKGGEIEIHPIRVFEEKMMTANVGHPTDRINRMIKSCMKTEFDIDRMLIVDRFYLMYQLSILSYGDSRDLKIKCGECRETFDKKVDLIKDITTTPAPDDLTEPVEITLPDSGDRVTLKFLRVKDEKEILELTDRLRKPAPTKAKVRAGLTKDDLYTVRMVVAVTKVNDQDPGDMEAKVEWANNLSGKDAATIRDAFNDFDFGVNPTFSVTCPNCEEVFQSAIPAEEYFRL